ncbi:uncharacterized protein LY89DRAFT_688599 [Mollisia scopiformis]|uniref:Uncharacterized protein n=1 Tax=Mollisia scopiformis TaxID=149040 RepID=A0A194WVZ1_MOLSC|nr:uncharacterized protein LY89DRAFT_688599 [Mollisia scopiformis]KUJ12133.1 hypothetical protein LY89DRAFT_688599 [Mollisia scopiformis]
MSPPPMIPVQEGYVPLVATVITRDPHTGVFRETEGLLKAGSVPVLAHMPVSLMGPPRNQENIPTGFVPPAPASYQMPSFPARSDMHTRQPSESSGSEINLRSGFGSNPLSPLGLRGRNDPLTNIANIRRAFSPDHQEEMDMQAKLQSRLNSSLAARQASLSPAHK